MIIRTALAIILWGLLFIMASTAQATPVCERPITSAIMTVSSLSCKDAFPIALEIYYKSRKYQLEWELMVAIIAQESMFRLDTMNCTKGLSKVEKKWVPSKVCGDFGPTQINYKTIKRLDLDAGKLLSDWEYALDTMGKILYSLKRRYIKIDPEFWWCRYHSSTVDLKHKYYDDVMRHYDKIKDSNE